MDDSDGCVSGCLVGVFAAIAEELNGKALIALIIIVAILLLVWYAISPDTFLRVW